MGEAEGLHGVGEVSLEREDHDESQLDFRDRGRKPNMFSRRFEALDVSWLVKGLEKFSDTRQGASGCEGN